MWKDKLGSLLPNSQFTSPATQAQIDHLEHVLQIAVSSELRALLAESNGITGLYELPYIWSVEEMISRNLEMRNSSVFLDNYMSFLSLLCITDEGTGNLFALNIIKNQVQNTVYMWEHEDDSRIWFAQSIEVFLQRWLNSQRK